MGADIYKCTSVRRVPAGESYTQAKLGLKAYRDVLAPVTETHAMLLTGCTHGRIAREQRDAIGGS